MSPTRIAAMVVRWILESPRAREELRQLDPVTSVHAALRLLDASFEPLVAADPELAHVIADAVDDLAWRLRGLSDAAGV